MSKVGKYIYGIILNVANQRNVSLGSRRNTEAETTFGINSNHQEFIYPIRTDTCREAHFISYQNIAAVVADSEIVDYTHMSKDALARALVEHQKVVEEIMSLGYIVIPMRLGTIASDEDEVRHILAKGYSFVKNIFDKILDKIEIDMVASFSDFTQVLKEVGEGQEIKEFKEKLLRSHKGITVDDQMKIGFMLKKALGEKREKLAFKIEDTLKTLNVDFKTHKLMDDKMVVNFAFLIDKAKQKEFYAKIEDLNNEFAEKLNFRCVGPLPAYSFYTLEVKKMQFNEVDWARKRLGVLNDAITKDEIKKIFQRQAFVTHPDKNPDKAEAEKEFDEIKKSYQILLDYAYSCEQGGRESIIFNEDEFKKNSLLVKLRE
jgi:hypothetical protein